MLGGAVDDAAVVVPVAEDCCACLEEVGYCFSGFWENVRRCGVYGGKGGKGGGLDLHGLPSVCAKEEVDDVVVHVGLAFEVAVDHLADGGCAVCKSIWIIRFVPSLCGLRMGVWMVEHTRESHNLDLLS